MIADSSIIFVLDTSLRVYQNFSSVNNLIFKLEKKPLNLASEFEQIWLNLWHNYLQNSNQIYFLQGSSAGFTDSRVIFIWLQNFQLFYASKKCNFGKIKFEKDITQALISAKPIYLGLEYISEPRIGA
jgi:hypothetical protein